MTQKKTPELVAHIAELSINDGTEVDLPPSCVVAFVGPNNSGKSTALRDTTNLLSAHRPPETLVVNSVRVEKKSGPDEAAEWLQHNGSKVTTPTETRYRLPRMDHLNMAQFQAQWESGPPFRAAGGAFVFFGGAQQRLQLISSVAQIDYVQQAPEHPLQALYTNADLEDRLSDISRDAFGTGVVLNRFAGSQLRLHFGERPAWRGVEGRPAADYLKELNELPVVEAQGDGVRSFLGVMLEVVVGDYLWLIVDEPEAFLHPPQARLLGRQLAKHGAKGRQVVVATHSTDVLQGLLAEPETATVVVRLTRDGAINRASVLTPDMVKVFWQDPLLRYSEALAGLFHEGVVVCESDADCRYYSSVLESVSRQDGVEPPDRLWIHSGGKNRMSVMVDALRAVGVQTAVVADIDILADTGSLKKIIESLGAEWTDFERDIGIVKAAVEGLSQPVDTRYLRQEMEARLESATEPNPTDRELDSMKQLLKARSGWGQMKRSGVSAIPQGDGSRSLGALIDRLAEAGLLVVPVGELERFVPDVGGHGPSWVSAVHEQGLHESVELTAPRDFVRRIARFGAETP